MLKIDVHAHYLPRDWPDLAAKYGDARFPVIHHGDDGRHRIYKDGKFFREIWPKTWDPKIRIDDYAGFGGAGAGAQHRAGDVQRMGKAAPRAGLHKALNEHMARTCRDYPRHYAASARCRCRARSWRSASWSAAWTSWAAGRADRLALNGPGGAHWNLDAPELFEFFQAASELGAAILVHPWDMMGTDTMPNTAAWLVGMPAEQSRAACCWCSAGCWNGCPLRVCMAMRRQLPYTIGRIEHVSTCARTWWH